MVKVMGEGQNETENKPKHKLVVVQDGIRFSDSVSVSTISGSIAQGYTALSPTFDVRQKGIADSYNLGENVQYLKEIAESMEKSVKLAQQQRAEAIEDARKDRNRFYVGVAIGIVGIVVGAIIGIITLLR
jgi:hypothetical protein